MSWRIINKLKWLYPRYVACTTIVGGIKYYIYYTDYIKKNNANLNIVDITIDGMIVGFIAGVTTPFTAPYAVLKRAYNIINE